MKLDLRLDLNSPRVEPVKRVKCLGHVKRGCRDLVELPRHIWHKYPIKGGITPMSLLLENINANDKLLAMLKARAK